MQSFFQSVWLIPCYSLIGAILTVPWSPGFIRKTGSRPAGYINLLMTLLSFVHALVALSVSWNQPAQHIVIPWLNVASLDISIPIEVSSLTIAAIVLITGLNLLAQIYAIGYMEMDWGWARFYGLMALFEGGMCALVLCDSLFCSYVILEILTLGTYLLVGLWFSQPMVVTGARDAFLTKRVGDLFLLMGVLALYPLAGTWNFTELATWAQTANLDPKVAALLGLALIAGPMSKCAQFPLHLWLDEAMEGPIPSTILRNSVVVATGAWVLVKLEPVIALSPVAIAATIFIGGLTAVGGSLIAIAQIDIKRALSYSVSAYMGLIFIAVGTGQTEAALLLVLTHAVAMALLYIVIGGVIWNSITQDLTKLGGIWSRRPLSGLAFLVGSAGLIALPPFGSFWAMLKLADGLWTTQPWLVGLLLAVNSLTAFSVTRVFGLIFAGQEKPMTVRSPEVGWQMVIPMMLLVGFTLHLPLVLQSFSLLPDWANLNKDVALLLIWSTIFGCSISAVIYVSDSKFKPQLSVWKPLQNLLAYDFYTPKLYRFSIVFAVDSISKITAWFDQYLIDGAVNLVGFATMFSGQGLRYNVSGQSQFYVLTILLGMTLFLGLLTLGAI
ncbi:MAG TPA: NAD(P)H-quinone oxidoreductase subunit F [Oculatellaceae cyanobacterium]